MDIKIIVCIWILSILMLPGCAVHTSKIILEDSKDINEIEYESRWYSDESMLWTDRI